MGSDLCELSQSGRMTKRIVEYFEESRSRKPQSAVVVKVEKGSKAPYPVPTFRRSSTKLLPGPPKRYLVKRNSNLVSTMEVQNKTTIKCECSIDMKPDIVEATWL